MRKIPLIQQICQRPILKPSYIDTNLHSFSEWYRANEPSLYQYWEQISAVADALEMGHEEDFMAFALSQYDIEVLRHRDLPGIRLGALA